MSVILLLFILHRISPETIGTMPAPALTTVTALQQEGSLENDETVFKVIVFVFLLLPTFRTVPIFIHLFVKGKPARADACREIVYGIAVKLIPVNSALPGKSLAVRYINFVGSAINTNTIVAGHICAFNKSS